MSEYKMQIASRKTGVVAEWKPGSAIEVDIADDLCRRLKERNIQPRLVLPASELLCERVKAHGIGLMTSEKAVLAAVKAEFELLMLGVRLEDNLVSESEVLTAIHEEFAKMVFDLKKRV